MIFCIFWIYGYGFLSEFSFVESKSTLGPTLSCASFLLFRSLVLDGQADLHITSAKQIVTAHAIWSPFGGFLEAHNLACSYPQQNIICSPKNVPYHLPFCLHYIVCLLVKPSLSLTHANKTIFGGKHQGAEGRWVSST